MSGLWTRSSSKEEPREKSERVGLATRRLTLALMASNRRDESRQMASSGEPEVLMYRRKVLGTIPVITRCNRKKN